MEYLDLSEKQLEKLKEKEYQILVWFDSFCKKHNLTWYPFAGTLIGVVRHQGFIPWDDDIDVCMPIEDYLKLFDVFENGDYFLQTFDTDSDYRRYFGKVRLNGTRFVECGAEDLNINHGVFIDIFPVFYAGNNKFTSRLRRSYLSVITQLLMLKNRKNMKANKLLKCLSCFYSIKRLKKIIRKHCYSLKKKNYVSVGSFTNNYKKEVFEKGDKGLFEKLEVTKFKGSEEYLTFQYENYMEPPPLEKRYGHHFCYEISIDD